jgi:hypothetical protein
MGVKGLDVAAIVTLFADRGREYETRAQYYG